ncbi:MAG: hypothetical protein WBB67_11865 [bacterium]
MFNLTFSKNISILLIIFINKLAYSDIKTTDQNTQIQQFYDFFITTVEYYQLKYIKSDYGFLDASEESLTHQIIINKNDNEAYWELAWLYFMNDYKDLAEKVFERIYKSARFSFFQKQTALEIYKDIVSSKDTTLFLDSVSIQIDNFGNATVEQAFLIETTDSEVTHHLNFIYPYKYECVKNISFRSEDLKLKKISKRPKWQNRMIVSLELEQKQKEVCKDFFHFSVKKKIFNYAEVTDSLTREKVVIAGYSDTWCPSYKLTLTLPKNTYVADIEPHGYSRKGDIISWNTPWREINNLFLKLEYVTPGILLRYITEEDLYIDYWTFTALIYIILFLSFLYYCGVFIRNHLSFILLCSIFSLFTLSYISLAFFPSFYRYFITILRQIVIYFSFNSMILPFLFIFVNLLLLISECIKLRYIKLNVNDNKSTLDTSLFTYITLIDMNLIIYLLFYAGSFLLKYIGSHTGKFYLVFIFICISSLIAIIKFKSILKISTWWLIGSIGIWLLFYYFLDNIFPEIAQGIKTVIGITFLILFTIFYLFLNIPRINTHLQHKEPIKWRKIIETIEYHMPRFWVYKKEEDIRKISFFFLSVAVFAISILFFDIPKALLFMVFLYSLKQKQVKIFLISFFNRLLGITPINSQ